MDADAEHDPPLLGDITVDRSDLLLNIESALERIDRA
jgi:hypothetical protein